MNTFMERASYPLRLLMVAVVLLFLGGVFAANRTMAEADRADVAISTDHGFNPASVSPDGVWLAASDFCYDTSFTGTAAETRAIMYDRRFRDSMLAEFMIWWVDGGGPHPGEARRGCANGIETAARELHATRA